MARASTEQILSEYSDVHDDVEGIPSDQIIDNHPSLGDLSAFADNFTTTGVWSVTTISFYLARWEANESDYDSYLAARFYEPDSIDPTFPDETTAFGDSIGVRVDSLPEGEGATVGAWINFTFATPVILINAHQYFFAVYGLNGTWDSGSSLGALTYGNDSDHARGFSCYTSAAWSYSSESYDLGYILYGEVISWRDLSNSAVVTIATILLPIVYMTGTALFFIHEKQKPDIKEIMVIAVGFILVTVLFPIGMNALLS